MVGDGGGAGWLTLVRVMLSGLFMVVVGLLLLLMVGVMVVWCCCRRC